MENWNTPITWIAGLVATATAGVVKHSFGTRKSLTDHKTYAAETFATKDELRRSTDNLTQICVRIETKLDAQIAKIK